MGQQVAPRNLVKVRPLLSTPPHTLYSNTRSRRVRLPSPGQPPGRVVCSSPPPPSPQPHACGIPDHTVQQAGRLPAPQASLSNSLKARAFVVAHWVPAEARDSASLLAFKAIGGWLQGYRRIAQSRLID